MPIGSKPTCAPSSSLRMRISTALASAQAARTPRPASSKLPVPTRRRRVGIASPSDRGLISLGHMPEHDVVVGLLHPWVARVIVHVDVVDPTTGRGEVVQLLVL